MLGKIRVLLARIGGYLAPGPTVRPQSAADEKLSPKHRRRAP